MGTKNLQVIAIIGLLILISYNLLRNDSCSLNKTDELIKENQLAAKRFMKAMQTDERDTDDFLNPLIRSGKISSKKGYLNLLKGMSEQDVTNLASQFHINGTEYLDDETKRDFLWCDPELIGTHVQPVRRVYRPCADMRFKKDTGRRVALASFPGSGSTWSRTLLEQATGVYTGAIYCDKKLKGEGFLGEFITSGNVIAIKTHQHITNISNPDRKHSVKFDAAIFIVRNVFDAIFSERKRSTSKNHTGQLNKEDFVENEEWRRYSFIAGYRYQRTVERWLKRSTIPLIVVRYEDLVEDTKTQLQRMLDFLEYPYTEERLDCVINHQVETFHRKHSQTFDPYTNRQRVKLRNIMKTIEPLLNKYGTSYSDMYNFS